MNENKNTLNPERQIMILGPRLEPLAERMGRDRFDGEMLVSDKRNQFIAGPTHEVSEQELLENYFEFLADVHDAAADDPSEAGREVLAIAERFARETTYLSIADARAAVRGLAASQADYLLADPDRQLFLYVPERSKNKSQGKFANDLASYLEVAFPEVQDRISVIGQDKEKDKASLEGVDPSNSKIVLLDDWAVTGEQLSREVTDAHQYLTVQSLEQFRTRLEVNMLAIRSDQVQDNFDNLIVRAENTLGLRPIAVRAFYTTRPTKWGAGPMPTGGHCSVDYGFQAPIAKMRDYLATETGDDDVLLPYLATITR